MSVHMVELFKIALVVDLSCVVLVRHASSVKYAKLSHHCI